MFSCSTCWNSGRHRDGEAMIDEILELGFENVELGHGIRLSLMEGILKAFDAGKVRFSSLHNFCPLPVEITRAAPDCYQFSSTNESERERAVRQTMQTIDFAVRLKAPKVVLHLGSVRMSSPNEELVPLLEKGGEYSRKHVKTKLKAIQTRAKLAPVYLQNTLNCLKRILEYAEKKQIQLGIEGRYGFEEIPSETEALKILEDFNSPWLGYWHDFGHIQVKHNLGFLDHAEWLSTVRPYLIGCHLHDVVWPGRDHRPPFRGSIGYDSLVPVLDKDTLLVWEMSPRVQAQRITESLEAWKQRFS